MHAVLQPLREAPQSKMEEEKKQGLHVWGALVWSPEILEEVGQGKRKACSCASAAALGHKDLRRSSPWSENQQKGMAF